MRPYISAVVIIFIIAAAGCERLFDKPADVSSADITDAFFLGVDNGNYFDMVPDPGLRNNLIKITSSNLEEEPEPVYFRESSGDWIDNEFAYVYAESVILLSPRYSVVPGEFMFTLKGGQTHSNALLLDQETGAVYDLEYLYYPCTFNTHLGSRYHQQDREGNIYFYGGGIRRLVFQDEDNIRVEQYMDYSSDELEDGYYVDPDGNIFFNRGRRVKLAAGGIVETGLDMICITGFDGKVYGFSWDPLDGSWNSCNLQLVELTITGQTIDTDTVATSNHYLESSDELRYFPDAESGMHFLLSGHFFQTGQAGFVHVPRQAGLAFNESDSSVYTVMLPEGVPESSSIMGLESHYLWTRTPGEILRLFALDLNIHTIDSQSGSLLLDQYTEFQIPGGLEIQKLWFNAQRIIEFSAYDLAAEKQIRGFISMAHGMEYYEEEKMGPVTLTRIR